MEFKQKFACMKDCSYIGEKQIEIIERISMDIYIYIYMAHTVVAESSDSIKLRGLVFALYFML